ncbi:MAG TPA: hypothetical protein VKB38_13215 [Terracidiphilus sp.]|nr:hypothetical protein [Terracidiphilus sp.]
MNNYPTKLAEAFSSKVTRELYARALFDDLVNRDYEGEIVGVGSILNILNLGKLTEKDYTGANLSVDDLTESNGQLVIDQQKSFYFRVKTLDKFKSYIKNPESIVKEQAFNERRKNIDKFVLGKYTKVAAGNRIGTNYATGTVTVDSSGNVTGSGTTFTSAMVGRGFQASGQTSWYRVATFTSTTAITITDDLDEVTQYTGGAVSGGTSYTIEAVTPIALTRATLLTYILQLKQKLDALEVPETDRVLVLPTEVANLIPGATGIVLNVPAAYEQLVVKGFITELVGFKIFSSARLTGDNTNGYHALAIQKNWQTFADKVLEAEIEEMLIGNFGAAYKDLFVYGSFVKDNRRKFAAELFCTGSWS